MQLLHTQTHTYTLHTLTCIQAFCTSTVTLDNILGYEKERQSLTELNLLSARMISNEITFPYSSRGQWPTEVQGKTVRGVTVTHCNGASHREGNEILAERATKVGDNRKTHVGGWKGGSLETWQILLKWIQFNTGRAKLTNCSRVQNPNLKMNPDLHKNILNRQKSICKPAKLVVYQRKSPACTRPKIPWTLMAPGQ